MFFLKIYPENTMVTLPSRSTDAPMDQTRENMKTPWIQVLMYFLIWSTWTASASRCISNMCIRDFAIAISVVPRTSLHCLRIKVRHGSTNLNILIEPVRTKICFRKMKGFPTFPWLFSFLAAVFNVTWKSEAQTCANKATLVIRGNWNNFAK